MLRVWRLFDWHGDPPKAARQRNEQALAANQKVMKGGSFLCHRTDC
jgi:hypothetical protein